MWIQHTSWIQNEFEPFGTSWRATNSITINVSPWILLMGWRLKQHAQLQQTKLAIASNDHGCAQNNE